MASYIFLSQWKVVLAFFHFFFLRFEYENPTSTQAWSKAHKTLTQQSNLRLVANSLKMIIVELQIVAKIILNSKNNLLKEPHHQMEVLTQPQKPQIHPQQHQTHQEAKGQDQIPKCQ